MKMTFQPKKRHRSKVHGFRKRMSTKGGRKVLAARRAKGRKRLSAQAAFMWPIFLISRSSGMVVDTAPIQRGKIRMIFSESLKKNIDFRNVYENGKSYANKYLVMYVLENNKNINRLGISASKKVGNSVVRHRFARLVRESYRLHENIFNSGLDIVVVARKSASTVGFAEIENALLHLSKLHHILKIYFYND